MPYVMPSALAAWIGLVPETDSDKAAARTALLTQLLGTAEARIHRVCGRTFYDRNPATGDGAVDPSDEFFTMSSYQEYLFLEDDLHELTAVSISDSTVPLSEIRLERFSSDPAFPYRALRRLDDSGNPRPWTSGFGDVNVKVTARWGWKAVPPGVAQCEMMIAARLYQRATTTLGVVMDGDAAYGGDTMMMPRWDSDIADMLSDYCTARVFSGVA